MTEYDQRRGEALLFQAGGSPARSAAAWLSAIDRAEREGRACPGWGELEELAPSLPTKDERLILLAELGQAVIGLAASAVLLGHRRVTYTARDYFHPASQAEVFLKDVFLLDTNDLLAKYPALGRPATLDLDEVMPPNLSQGGETMET